MFYGFSGEYDAPAILKGFNQYSTGPQPAVAEIQRVLVLLGYMLPTQKSGKSSIDGVWGPQTKAAYKAATGTEQVTAASLGILLSKVLGEGKKAVDTEEIAEAEPPKGFVPPRGESAIVAPGKSGLSPAVMVVGGVVLVGVAYLVYSIVSDRKKSEKRAVPNKRRR